MNFKIGDSATVSKTITDDDIRLFADLIGDHNSIHLDEEFARKSRFGRRVAHGMLSAALISTVIGNELPGPGTAYLGQTFRFVAPVFPGDTVTARVTITKIREDKPIVTLETLCVNQHDETVIKGEAVVRVDNMQ
jgi:3-hydroxybutyryl-CoA dehydratase